jgi:mRNA-degrading endonuclease RelE of RelBE toxin-antitoxin system
MKFRETSKFRKLRRKLVDADERDALRQAVLRLAAAPESGKKLKGELCELRSLRFAVRGQPRRLVYKIDKDMIVLFSFGPRQGIYK